MKLIIFFVVSALGCLTCAEETSFSDYFPKEFQLTDYVQIKRNDYQNNEVEARNDKSLENNVEEYIKGHDVTFNFPIVGSTLTLAARNLDNDEVDLKFNFNSGSEAQARKKSKLKKIFVPILVFLLIKAMVMIPLALGILAIKTWNALQLSFVSFVIAVALGVWQLCKKVGGDSVHAPIVAHSHNPWEAHKRAFDVDEAQKLAYSAYAPDLTMS